MQIWQMDVMTGVLLDDGTELKIVTGLDDHSRFCVAAGLVRRKVSPEHSQEFLADRTFQSLEAAQTALDEWVSEYNNERPHQALELATPSERFVSTRTSKHGALVSIDSAEEHKGQWILRRVGSNGYVSVDTKSPRSGPLTKSNWWTSSSTDRWFRSGAKTISSRP